MTKISSMNGAAMECLSNKCNPQNTLNEGCFFNAPKSWGHALTLVVSGWHQRSKAKEQKLEHNDEFVASYVDTLLNLALPEENRNLNHGENVSLCSEFLSVRTDTMSTFLEWVMANLVKKPSIQEKLYQEIASVVGDNQFTEEVVKEEDLQKMPNLKAVVLEGPRRHPPSHFVLHGERMR
ncbi:hypothetical protein FXO38_10423 [Capsicum annuum]|nr:hypothetical protein FXO38_10423 [Capsicum annuum]